MTKLHKLLFLFLFILKIGYSSEYEKGYDQYNQEQRAKVLEISGQVTVQDPQGNLRNLKLGDYLFESEFVTTNEDAHVLLNFQSNGRIAMDPKSSLFLGPITKNNLQHIHLLNGRVSYSKNKKLINRVSGLFFSLPFQNELFNGPELELHAQGKQSRVFVLKGQLTRINLAPKSID